MQTVFYMPFVWVYYLYLQVVLLTLTVHRKLAGDSKLATSVSGVFFPPLTALWQPVDQVYWRVKQVYLKNGWTKADKISTYSNIFKKIAIFNTHIFFLNCSHCIEWLKLFKCLMGFLQIKQIITASLEKLQCSSSSLWNAFEGAHFLPL